MQLGELACVSSHFPGILSNEALVSSLRSYWSTDYMSRLLDLGPESSIYQYICSALLGKDAVDEVNNRFGIEEMAWPRLEFLLRAREKVKVRC